MSGYLLDTNVFNRLVDANIDPRRPDRAAQLLEMFEAVEREQIPTAAALYGIS